MVLDTKSCPTFATTCTVTHQAPQSCPTLCDPMDWNSPGQNAGVGSLPFSRGSSQPRDRTQVSNIAGGFLPAEPQGKPKNTEVGSLSLLQQIFLIQELNWDLLHCRQILYQLSYQGRPIKKKLTLNPATFPNTITSVGNCRKARTRGLVV